MAKASRLLGRWALTAHLGWIAALLVHFIWGAATGRGLYGVLMRWQIELGDAYSDLPMMLLHLALAVPSIWLLFGHLDAIDKGKRAREPRRLLPWAWGTFGLAGALAATAIVCFVMIPPSRGYIAPVEISATQLLRGDYLADAPIRLWAQPVPGADYGYRELRGRVGPRETAWRGVKPLERLPNRLTPLPAPSGPVSLFQETDATVSSERGRLADVIAVSGKVVRNGLPELARQGLEEAGVTIAEPHYVLRNDEPVSFWSVAAWACLILAFSLSMMGTVLLLAGTGAIPVARRM